MRTRLRLDSPNSPPFRTLGSEPHSSDTVPAQTPPPAAGSRPGMGNVTPIRSRVSPERADVWETSDMSLEHSAADPASLRSSTDRESLPDSTDIAVRARGFLLRVQGGDREAFASLYDLFVSRVLGLVRHVLVDHAQAEEVTQEVFLEVWQRASTFDPERGSVSGWLMTLAHRRAIDRVRASQAGRNRDERIGIRDLPIPVDEVAETVETRVEHTRVERALGHLSPPQREAVLLAYYEGFTQTEIAERLKIPLGTVKTRIRDGMIKLRQILGEEVTA